MHNQGLPCNMILSKCRLPCAAIQCARSALHRNMLLLPLLQGLHLSAALPAYGSDC